MNKKYVILFGNGVSRDSVKSALDASPLVVTWRQDLPQCFYFVSSADAQTLYNDLNPRISTTGVRLYLIAELAGSFVQGHMPKEAWEFLNKKY